MCMVNQETGSAIEKPLVAKYSRRGVGLQFLSREVEKAYRDEESPLAYKKLQSFIRIVAAIFLSLHMLVLFVRIRPSPWAITEILEWPIYVLHFVVSTLFIIGMHIASKKSVELAYGLMNCFIPVYFFMNPYRLFRFFPSLQAIELSLEACDLNSRELTFDTHRIALTMLLLGFFSGLVPVRWNVHFLWTMVLLGMFACFFFHPKCAAQEFIGRGSGAASCIQYGVDIFGVGPKCAFELRSRLAQSRGVGIAASGSPAREGISNSREIESAPRHSMPSSGACP